MRKLMVMIGAASVAAAAQAFDIQGDGAESVTYANDRKIVTFRQSGTLTVTGSGEADVLIVGGGGGGGDAAYDGSGNVRAGWPAGGGAGGLYYKQKFYLQGGAYPITVGAGGEVGVNGGDSIAFGLTAPGGGHGAQARGLTSDRTAWDGGCGGGAVGNTGWNYAKSGGLSTGDHSDPDYHGFAGGASANAYGNESVMTHCVGGGGGAGGAGYAGDHSTTPGQGGIGYPCSITGSEVYYAGGGGGGGKVNGVDTRAAGGLGGGGANTKAGTDGLGGGGGGFAKGGSGVVILRFKRIKRGLFIVVR